MLSTIDSAKRLSILERLLSIFAPVQIGEGFTAFLLTTNVFLLLTAYYLIKPVREALILSGAGAEIKSYAGAGQALMLFLLVPVYGVIASKVNRLRLINGMTAFFISNLLIFYVLGEMKLSLGVVFFLWVGLFNLIILAQFWSFANDLYTQEQGKRLFAIIGIGSSLGAIFGAEAAQWLFRPLGAYSMMLVTAVLLGVCMILTNWVHYREGSRNGGRRRVAREPIAAPGGFQLIMKSRYLLLIAILVLLANFTKTTGEFILGKTVSQHAASAVAASGSGLTQQAYIGEFYADFYFWVNLAGAVLQMFVVSRIMKYMGIGAAVFFLPLIAMAGYTSMALAPVLSFIRIVKIAENSTDYSIQNTARQALFLRTSRGAKYKAKFAIDSFFARAGDASSALLVFAGTRLAFGLREFALINGVLVIIWLVVAAAILRLRQEEPADSSINLRLAV
jgi:AAA family ATP:ADP antiporter